MRARVYQFVRDDQVAALRQGAEQGKVADIAIGDEQRRLGAEEVRGLGFEPFMFGRIAAQQPRSARPHRHAPCNRIRHRPGDDRIGGEAEIIVGGEIAPRTGHQATQPPARVQSGKLSGEGFGGHGARYRPLPKGEQAAAQPSATAVDKPSPGTPIERLPEKSVRATMTPSFSI